MNRKVPKSISRLSFLPSSLPRRAIGPTCSCNIERSQALQRLALNASCSHLTIVSLSPRARLFSTTVQRNDDKLAQPPAPTDLLELYRGLVASGRLKWDDEQVRCVMKLRQLLSTLEDYSPPVDLVAKLTPSAPFVAQEVKRQSSWLKGKERIGDYLGIEAGQGEEERKLVKVLSGEEELANLSTPKGILLTGPPGTGKSLLLSLFFQLLPLPKRRVHYHAFTLSLYRQVFLEMERRRTTPSPLDQITKNTENMDMASKKGWKAVFANGRWDEEGKERRTWAKEEGMAFIIARKMMLDYHVLYFDEFQLVDASSAALIRDVLSWYWRLGGVVVACSNRVPEDLYHHGVQRDRMIGFLDALKSRCEVVQVDGGIDWRSGSHEEAENKIKRWYGETDKGFDNAWREAVGDQESGPKYMSVYGRKVIVPAAAGKSCRFTFADLCEEALGPADYLTLASIYSTIFIDEVPILYLKFKNEARRLINLVDALYESRCQIHVRSSATSSTLFFPDALELRESEVDDMTNERIMAAESLSETVSAPYRPNTSLYNATTPTQREKEKLEDKRKANSFSVLGIWTGEDEKFAYKRAVSRLVEMTTSSTYAAEDWLPLDNEARTWEASTNPTTSFKFSRPRSGASLSPFLGKVSDDLAVEAGYSRPGRMTPDEAQERKSAPVIKEQHMWGVADEWGEKAGHWGKGVKANDPKRRNKPE
ncbi:uncharacterized protein IL334_006682 [Kwoniella shivajii]|uniref:AAA+ ATPase domain-containing protein n=1 Tax=Kwoniella shivajii TaxID=564305 RepID=A0ABZ1D7V8_9TREE|nr:hypothetical protein IL334_006682 [Kwoniella shivajii]